MIAIQGNNVRIDKTCPNQHVINDRKLTDFCHFVDKLLSIRTFSVNILSLWTIFYQFSVNYDVLIRTLFLVVTYPFHLSIATCPLQLKTRKCINNHFDRQSDVFSCQIVQISQPKVCVCVCRHTFGVSKQGPKEEDMLSFHRFTNNLEPGPCDTPPWVAFILQHLPLETLIGEIFGHNQLRS